MKKILAFFIVFGLLMQPFSVFGNIDIKTKDDNHPFIDIDGHWAEETIIRHYEMGMFEGYPDGTFKPNQAMKRSELITVLNRYFGLKENEDSNFEDVSSEDWYAEETAQAKYYGYIEELSVRAEEPAKRQDVVKMIGLLLDVEEQELIQSSINFTDLENIDEDMKVIIEKFTEMGWINGYGDNTFRPEEIIKRAEIMTISENVLGYIVSSQEDLENIPEDVKKVTIINPSIKVENKTIKGDLYVSPGVNGQIIIKDTHVKGQIQVAGGPIQIENVEVPKVVITKAKKPPKVEIKGESKVGEVKTKTESKIEVAGKTIVEEVNIEAKTEMKISEETVVTKLTTREETTIEMTGNTKVEQLNTKSKTVMKMQEGTQVDKLVINEETKVDTDKGSTIGKLESKGKTEITGAGKIEKAIIESDEVTIEKEPDYVKVDNDVDGVKIAGKEVDSKNDDHRASSSGGDRTLPSGYSVSIDQSFITESKVGTILSFTFAGAEVGATYNYSIDDTNAGTTFVTGNATVNSATQQISNIDVSSLTDGTLTLTVYLTDIAGNQGLNVTDTITKDTIAPVAPTVSGISTGSYNTDQSFTVSGESGATFEYSLDNGINWSTYSSEVSLSVEGTYEVIARQTDAAENQSANSSLITVTIDKTAPDAPTVSGITTGSYNTDQSFTVNGESGATLEYSLDNGISWSTYSSAVTLLAEGIYEVIARQTDADDNHSVNSSLITVTIDKTAPDAPTVSGITTGSYNTDQSFTVNGESGATLEYSLDNGISWSTYSSAVTLSAEGTYEVIARQTDAAENQSTNSSLITVTIDKAPNAPTVSGISTGSYNTAQSFTVSGESGATLEYSLDNGISWSTYLSAVSLSAEGTYEVIARQTDTAENQSANSSLITVIIDKTVPIITLNGASTVEVVKTTTYTDKGVKVIDDTDTGLTATVTYSKDGASVSSIDTSVFETYMVHYNVSDNAGNRATEVTRIVNIVAPLYVSGINIRETLGFSYIVEVEFTREIKAATEPRPAIKLIRKETKEEVIIPDSDIEVIDKKLIFEVANDKLSKGVIYYIDIPNGLIIDTSGNVFEGRNDLEVIIFDPFF